MRDVTRISTSCHLRMGHVIHNIMRFTHAECLDVHIYYCRMSRCAHQPLNVESTSTTADALMGAIEILKRVPQRAQPPIKRAQSPTKTAPFSYKRGLYRLTSSGCTTEYVRFYLHTHRYTDTRTRIGTGTGTEKDKYTDTDIRIDTNTSTQDKRHRDTRRTEA